MELGNNMKKLVCAISDLHGDLPKIDPCELVLICGDIMPLDKQRSMKKSKSWFVNNFIPWCESLPCKKVMFIAGNHDFWLYYTDYEIIYELCSNKVKYLRDNMFEYEGIKVYGIPWCIGLPNWAFYTKDEHQYENIPECDIIITHQPPSMGLVGTVLQSGFNYMRTFASVKLANNIGEIKPKYALCGHVHSGNHVPETINDVTYVNVSIKDEDYNVTYEPFYFEI